MVKWLTANAVATGDEVSEGQTRNGREKKAHEKTIEEAVRSRLEYLGAKSYCLKPRGFPVYPKQGEREGASVKISGGGQPGSSPCWGKDVAIAGVNLIDHLCHPRGGKKSSSR